MMGDVHGHSRCRRPASATAACVRCSPARVHAFLISQHRVLHSLTLAPSPRLAHSRAHALHAYTNTQEAKRARPPRGQTCPWDSSLLSLCNLQIRARVQAYTCARERWLRRRMLPCRLLAAGPRPKMKRSVHRHLQQHEGTAAQSPLAQTAGGVRGGAK